MQQRTLGGQGLTTSAIGLGTMFRFWAYKRFVFLHPDKVNSQAADREEELAETN